MENKRYAVLGGGSWATAIVKMLCETQETINWWIRDEGSIDHIRKYRHNPRYIQSIQFFNPNQLNMNSDLQTIVDQSDVLIVAIPSAFLADAFDKIDISGVKNKIMVTAVKGIIPQYNQIPAEYLHKRFGIPFEKLAMIAGPCHAEEVAYERLSYLTIGSMTQNIAEEVAAALTCRFIKTSTTNDVIGIEACAILKNIYAVASGIYHGLGYGDNFQAVLISNAIQETANFLSKVYPVERDICGSAYLGDLLVTGYSQFSRNRNFGSMVGKGYSIKSAQIEMNMVAEGYYAAKSLHQINKEQYQIEMPIAEAVYRVCYDNISPILEMRILADNLS